MLKFLFKSSVFSFFCAGFFCFSAFAAPTPIVENGQLIGAYDVDVNGVVYDVRFVEGSLRELFYSSTDDTWNFDFDSTGAFHATRALVDQVYRIDGVWTEFIDSPSFTFGIGTGHSQMRLLTPYTSVGGASGIPHSMVYMYQGYKPTAVSSQGYSGADTRSDPGYVYADWTVSNNSVPVPGTFILLGLGIIGVAGTTRRKFKN